MYVHACVCDSDTKQRGGLDIVFHEGRNQTCTWCCINGWVTKTESSCMNMYVCEHSRRAGKCACGTQSRGERARTGVTGNEGVSAGGSVEE